MLDCTVDVFVLRKGRTLQTVRESCVHDLKMYKVVYDHLKSCSVCDPNDVLNLLHERAKARSRKNYKDWERTRQVYVANTFAKQVTRFLRTFRCTDPMLCGKIISHSGAIDQVNSLIKWHQLNTLAGVPKEFVVNFFRNNIISMAWIRAEKMPWHPSPKGHNGEEYTIEDVILRLRGCCEFLQNPILTEGLYQAVHETDPEVWNRISCFDVVEG